jgi:nicotinamidase-related amidase
MKNLQALTRVASEFQLQTIVTSYMNQTYGQTVDVIVQILPNATLIGRNNPEDVLAFDNQQLLSALTDSGKRNVIIAGSPSDYGLLYNALAAKDQGFNVWAVVDASPSYEALGASMVLARLVSEGVHVISWLGLSREFAAATAQNNPDIINRLNSIYTESLPGFQAQQATSQEQQ